MKNEEMRNKDIDIRVGSDLESYFDGNAARVLNEAKTATEPVRIPREHEIRRYEPEPEYEKTLKPRVGRAVDLFFAAVLTVAIMVTLYICINYLQIQSDIVQLEGEITALENQISSAEKENDALESVMDSESYDLEEIYETAVSVLGMVYPNKNEVFRYSSEGSSYYRDFSSVK